MLARETELFMVVVERGEATCRRWTVAPIGTGKVKLLRDHDELLLETAPGLVKLVARRTKIGDVGAAEMITCDEALATRELGDGLDLEGARWFGRQADCENARAHKQRVATDLSWCELAPPASDVSAHERKTSHRKLDRVLERGGTLYANLDDHCQPVRVIATPSRHRGELEGQIVSALHSAPDRLVTSYGYKKRRDDEEITILGPSSVETNGETSISGGMLCADRTSIDLGRDTALGMYFSRASCRAALAVDLATRAWLPAEPPDSDANVAGADSMPAPMLALGGC